LPTKEEWEAFYSTVYDDPAMDNTVENLQWSEDDAFTGVQSNSYWSSTEYGSGLASAWFCSMHWGSMAIIGKDASEYVWPVRSDN